MTKTISYLKYIPLYKQIISIVLYMFTYSAYSNTVLAYDARAECSVLAVKGLQDTDFIIESNRATNPTGLNLRINYILI